MTVLVRVTVLLLILCSHTFKQSHCLLEEFYDSFKSLGSYFSDPSGTLMQVLEGIRFFHDLVDSTVEEDCEFRCEKGYIPVANPRHVPSANGCGSLGLKWAREQMPVAELTDCCDSHDLCYDQCGADKAVCDDTFKRCLYSVCRQHAPHWDQLHLTGCKAAAKLLYTGTLALGCKPYRDAQRDACLCVPATSSRHREL